MDPLITPELRAVMDRLEVRDSGDREDGTSHSDRLRSVRPEVGRFLHALVLGIGASRVVECGTSGGYSTLWLAAAAASTGGSVTTFEIDPAKITLAQEGFDEAGVAEIVELRQIDAAKGLLAFEADVDLVFIDIEKDQYEGLLPAAVRALRPGGTLVADNLLSHERELAGFHDAVMSHPDLSAVVVPIGRGELLAVRTP